MEVSSRRLTCIFPFLDTQHPKLANRMICLVRVNRLQGHIVRRCLPRQRNLPPIIDVIRPSSSNPHDSLREIDHAPRRDAVPRSGQDTRASDDKRYVKILLEAERLTRLAAVAADGETVVRWKAVGINWALTAGKGGRTGVNDVGVFQFTEILQSLEDFFHELVHRLQCM